MPHARQRPQAGGRSFAVIRCIEGRGGPLALSMQLHKRNGKNRPAGRGRHGRWENVMTDAPAPDGRSVTLIAEGLKASERKDKET